MVLRRVLGSLLVGVSFLVFSSISQAQDFSKTVFFGDSNTDTGWFIRQFPFGQSGVGVPPGRTWPLPEGAQGSSSGRPVWSEVIASYLGTSADPANAPNGTNYAIAGAEALANRGPSLSVRTQVSNYLAANGGRADPNALHFVWVGVNESRRFSNNFSAFGPGVQANIRTAAEAQVADIARLQAAGARYIVVNAEQFAANNIANNARNLYNSTLFNGLKAAGVEFIPADMRSVAQDVNGNAALFGITNTTGQGCGATMEHAIWCTPNDLVTPDAQQTYLRLDQGGHVSAAVNKIFADYIYSLIAAPSQISMLAEAALKTRAGSGVVGTILDQIPMSWRSDRAARGNAWVMGDVSWLDIDNYPGLPDISAKPRMLTAGADYKLMPGLLIGGAISAGSTDVDFGNRPDGAALGGFTQHEWAVSAYAALKAHNVTLDVIGTYGRLDYDIHRLIPMGILTRETFGDTDGTNWSLAAQVGYDFKWHAITHGPIAGLTYQRVDIDGFAEAPGATTPDYLALTFGGQTRDSMVSSLGWRLSWDAGLFAPFAKAVWKHEFDDNDRTVTATITGGALPSLVGPLSYSLPAVDVGRDWASLTVGTELKFAPNISGVVSGTGAFGQDDVTKYDVQVGLRISY